MKAFYTIVLTALLGQGVSAHKSKLNQYASMEDCLADTNRISHASPAVWSCHRVDERTKVVFLKRGWVFQHYFNRCDYHHDNFQLLPSGSCINLPAGTTHIGKFLGPLP